MYFGIVADRILWTSDKVLDLCVSLKKSSFKNPRENSNIDSSRVYVVWKPDFDSDKWKSLLFIRDGLLYAHILLKSIEKPVDL